MRRSLVIPAVAFAIIAFYFIFDPMEWGFMPRCTFHLLTGLDCPGCGMQRMTHALLHADFEAAWNANPFLLCSLPLLFVLVFIDFKRASWQKLYKFVNSTYMIALYLTLIVGWGVYRNL